uniref:cell wall synthase accessory phosphoprotein MacP n=1 Tax=Enterococcus faecium TaxID=1352 RepID=UPI0030C866AC
MSKGPLVTRTELRKRREAEEKEAERRQQEEQKLAEKAHKRKEKEISTFYHKEKKKQKQINKSRVGEYSKSRKRSHWINNESINIRNLLSVVAEIGLNLLYRGMKMKI